MNSLDPAGHRRNWPTPPPPSQDPPQGSAGGRRVHIWRQSWSTPPPERRASHWSHHRGAAVPPANENTTPSTSHGNGNSCDALKRAGESNLSAISSKEDRRGRAGAEEEKDSISVEDYSSPTCSCCCLGRSAWRRGWKRRAQPGVTFSPTWKGFWCLVWLPTRGLEVRQASGVMTMAESLGWSNGPPVVS